MVEEIKINSEKTLGASFCLLFDEINRDVSKEVVLWILEANFSDERPEILNLVINSPGGELASAFAIIDAIESSSVPVRTIGLGEISSAGLMVFISGHKGQRILTPSTSIMSHRWSGIGGIGKSHELIAAQKDTELTSKRMINHYIKHTGLTEKRILEVLLPHHDVFLSAEESKKFGICDKVALLG